jgi:hypothetical protein
MDNRNASLTRFSQEFLNMRECVPPIQAAAARPFCDGFQYWLGFVSENPSIEIDQNQGRLLAEATPAWRPHCQMRPVSFG